MLIKLKRLLTLLTIVELSHSAPKTWPYMKTYDIWETNKTVEQPTLADNSLSYRHGNSFAVEMNRNPATTRKRKAKGESLYSSLRA